MREHQKRPQKIAYLLPVRLEGFSVPRIRLDDQAELKDLHWFDILEDESAAISKVATVIWAQWNRIGNE